VPPAPDWAQEAIALLHDGRFDEAETVLAVFPGPETTLRWEFLRAYVTYWRLIFDVKNPELLTRLEDQLDRALDSGLDADGVSDSRDIAWAGAARLIRAQVYFGRKKYFKAAFEAKRGRALMLEADERDLADASFSLGTYNYYASRLPAVVKGFSFVLALPGGDHDLGIEQLRTAVQSSPHFYLEARILLISILSSSDEGLYSEAFQEVDLALERERSVTALYAAGMMDLTLGRPRAASGRFDHALERAAGNPGTDTAVLARIRLQLARAELALFRPDLALEQLGPLLDGDLATPLSMQEDLERIVTRASRWSPSPPGGANGVPAQSRRSGERAADDRVRRALGRARPALDFEAAGDLGASARRLVELADEQPDDPVLALLAGRAVILLGRPEPRASSLLRFATDHAADLPREWRGACRLFAGHAADLASDHATASRYYRKAVRPPGLVSTSATYFYREHPYPGLQQGE
jgi:tetratricopeptide (TPR) repeat protein